MFDLFRNDPFGDAMRALRERLAAPRRDEARGVIGSARCGNCGRGGLLYARTPVGASVALEPATDGAVVFDKQGNAQYVGAGGTHVEHRDVCPARGARP